MLSSRRARRPILGIAALVVGASALSGCASTVSMKPAPEADSPDCAAVIVRLPDSVGGQPRHWTDAQATGAWDSVLLTCGIPAPGPTELPCETVDGVDWIIDNSEAPRYRFTTYGRSPAVEVYLDYDVVSARAVLSSLSPAVGMLPQTGDECIERPADS
ncbi:DUF3515 family protein [Microbacterium sp.]|uniref:DUF3515 family protein n=1 Tax=Microbacterium sp. TaxID=51671 RepID=UPI0039E3F68B